MNKKSSIASWIPSSALLVIAALMGEAVDVVVRGEHSLLAQLFQGSS